MDHNPYEPPRAKLDPRTREPGPIPKAVAIGAAIDIGGTVLLSLLVQFIYAIVLSAQGHSSAQIESTLTKFDPFSPLGLLLMAMGMGMSVLGGYQCAVIANRTSYLAPGIVSLISVAFGAFASSGLAPLSQLLLLSGLTVAAILVGASLHIRKL